MRKYSGKEEGAENTNIKGKIPRIQLTQRNDPNFVNLSQFRLNLKADHAQPVPDPHSSNCETENTKRNYAAITNYFTSREPRVEDYDQSKSAALCRLDQDPLNAHSLKLQTGNSETTPLANFY